MPDSPVRASRRTADASRRTRDLLRAELHRGGYPDNRLPSEDTLMAQYQASRAVIREALALLRAEGLIHRIQGIGTIALNPITPLPLDESQGVVEPGPDSPFAGRSWPTILDHSWIELPAAIAGRLDVPTGSRGLRIDYVGIVQGEPAWVATNYVRSPEAERLDRSRFTTDFYAYLADCGLHASETSYLMEATLADEMDSALLGIPVGAPVMAGEQTLFNAAGEPFNFALVRGRGDKSLIQSRAGGPRDPRG